MGELRRAYPRATRSRSALSPDADSRSSCVSGHDRSRPYRRLFRVPWWSRSAESYSLDQSDMDFSDDEVPQRGEADRRESLRRSFD
jgi:hypothetical protein